MPGSHNEWDRLREVIVGTVDHMTVGLEFASPQPVSPELLRQAEGISRQAIPSWYQEEVQEDLEELAKMLRGFGVVVHRPSPYGSEKLYGTADWHATGKDLCNVRDLHLVAGNTVIACPSPAKCRQHEPEAFGDIWKGYSAGGFRVIQAPKPRLAGSYLIPYYLNGQEEVTEEATLHRKLSGGRWETFHRLTEDEVVFDAANVVRLGKDLIYLVSCTGNRKGAHWLQETLGDNYRVHITSTYRASHLDSTIVPLRPGLVLFNGVRVNPGNCPEILDKWDKIYFTDVAPIPPEELDFQNNIRDRIYLELLDMGVETDLNHMCSPWLGLNVLSIDPQTVLVHDRQAKLIKTLEQHGMKVVPIRLRHCYTMLGGPHCSTLDTVRDGELEDYAG
jgi:glycine amidinotransferase/scyllo-inosamine-4-phosphate amidinotransferase 1